MASLQLWSLVLAAPSAASAQTVLADARWQIAGGYSLLIETDITGKETLPAGWVVGAAMRLNSWLSLAGDIDGQFKTIPSFDGDIHFSSHALTGGLRASARLGKFIEFGQLQAGVVQSTGSAFGTTDSTRYVAVQPGLGFDYPVGAMWAIRGELDVRFLSTGQEIRVITGVVRAVGRSRGRARPT